MVPAYFAEIAADNRRSLPQQQATQWGGKRNDDRLYAQTRVLDSLLFGLKLRLMIATVCQICRSVTSRATGPTSESVSRSMRIRGAA